MVQVKIIIRNTGFELTVLNLTLLNTINSINKRMTKYDFIYNKYTRKSKKVEGAKYYLHKSDTNFIYPISILQQVVSILGQRGLTRDEIELTYDKDYPIRELNLSLLPKFKDLPHQPPYINALLDVKAPVMQLVDLKTGKGKGYISLRATTALNYATGVLVLPKYIQKWIDEVIELTGLDEKYFYVCQGLDSLKMLLECGDVEYKFIIFSITTLRLYSKMHKLKPCEYPVSLSQVLPTLGIGTIINDEAHQSFHAINMVLLELNPKKVIALSATLKSKDQEMIKFYKIYYPDEARISNLVNFDNYHIIHGVMYSFPDVNYIKYLGAAGLYNHIDFEHSILRIKKLKRKYMDMIKYYAETHIKRKQEGEKLLIFVASINFATALTNYFKKTYKDLNIVRYVEDDEYEHLLTSDITITTNLSAGTAFDIPNLLTVIQTVSVSSYQTNEQAPGRLREIKGRDVIYWYLYTPNIDKQVNHNKDRVKVLSDIAKEYTHFKYPYPLTIR